MFRRALLPIMAILIGSMILGSPPTADAAFKLRFDIGADGSFEREITDRIGIFGDANDLNPTAGRILYDSTVSEIGGVLLGWELQSRGTSKPPLDGGRLDLLQLVLSSTVIGKVAIELTDTDFSLGGSFPYAFHAGGTTDSDSSLFSFEGGGGSSNVEYDLTSSTGALAAVGGTSFVADGTFGPTTADPFSLTIRAVIEHTEIGQITTFDAFLTPMPAPGAVVLLCTAVPCLVAGVMRRRKGAVS